MQFTMRRFAAGPLVAVAVASASGGARADEPVVTRNVIQVQALNLRNASGVVRCTLFSGPVGFPGDAAKAASLAIGAIKDGQAICEFANVPPGVYAVGMLHDENNNGKMDTNMLGIPTEGYGASNDARGSFGPPSFNDARFSYTGGVVILRLKTAY